MIFSESKLASRGKRQSTQKFCWVDVASSWVVHSSPGITGLLRCWGLPLHELGWYVTLLYFTIVLLVLHFPILLLDPSYFPDLAYSKSWTFGLPLSLVYRIGQYHLMEVNKN